MANQPKNTSVSGASTPARREPREVKDPRDPREPPAKRKRMSSTAQPNAKAIQATVVASGKVTDGGCKEEAEIEARISSAQRNLDIIFTQCQQLTKRNLQLELTFKASDEHLAAMRKEAQAYKEQNEVFRSENQKLLSIQQENEFLHKESDSLCKDKSALAVELDRVKHALEELHLKYQEVVGHKNTLADDHASLCLQIHLLNDRNAVLVNERAQFEAEIQYLNKTRKEWVVWYDDQLNTLQTKASDLTHTLELCKQAKSPSSKDAAARH